ncbi:hypothetical protein HDV00_002229 [Rhizophlyctis rosea]|nr:hypothetical protein HDV00_002229 [Rhizophlyctis rosea]
MYHEEKKIRCEVFVDGQPLPEYQVEVDGDTMTCWLAVEAGSYYEVSITNDGYPTTDEHMLGGILKLLKLDGRHPNISAKHLPQGQTSMICGRWLNATTLQRLQFGRLASQREENYESSGEPSTLSTICVSVWKARLQGPEFEKTAEAKTLATTVDERAVKKGGRLLDTLSL